MYSICPPGVLQRNPTQKATYSFVPGLYPARIGPRSGLISSSQPMRTVLQVLIAGVVGKYKSIPLIHSGSAAERPRSFLSGRSKGDTVGLLAPSWLTAPCGQQEGSGSKHHASGEGGLFNRLESFITYWPKLNECEAQNQQSRTVGFMNDGKMSHKKGSRTKDGSRVDG